MKNIIKNTLFLVILLKTLTNGFGQATIKQNTEGSKISFDADWKFKKGSGLAAQTLTYNDADWRQLDLPHDWSIEDLPNQNADSIKGPFSKASLGKNLLKMLGK